LLLARKPKDVGFYCGALPIVHSVNQRRILFYKKLQEGQHLLTGQRAANFRQDLEAT